MMIQLDNLEAKVLRAIALLEEIDELELGSGGDSPQDLSSKTGVSHQVKEALKVLLSICIFSENNPS